MHEILFQLGPVTIRSYGLMAATGFILGIWMVMLTRTHAGMNKDQASGVVFWAMINGIIGARIFYVILNFHEFEAQIWRIIRIDQGGLVFYGGFFLALLAITFYSRLHKLDLVRVLDTFAPALALAHICGRIGCFLNGCCYGTETSSPLGVIYPATSVAGQVLRGAAVHPAQLYEAAGLLIGFPFFFCLAKKGNRGFAMSIYLIYYGILRFVVEFFRGDNPFFAGLTPAQWIGLALIPAGLIFLRKFWKQARIHALPN